MKLTLRYSLVLTMPPGFPESIISFGAQTTTKIEHAASHTTFASSKVACQRFGYSTPYCFSPLGTAAMSASASRCFAWISLARLALPPMR